MKLTDQVCSLELAKRLKELGVRQESAFYWVFNPFGDKNYKLSFFGCKVQSDNFDIVSAFTVAELGEMLPRGFWLVTFFHSLEIQVSDMAISNVKQAETEANARAKMLIHLIEKGIVNP